jgi:hypothetical protein
VTEKRSKTTYSFYLKPENVETVRKIAEFDNRSISWIMDQIIERTAPAMLRQVAAARR